jgi:hypothetical protein
LEETVGPGRGPGRGLNHGHDRVEAASQAHLVHLGAGVLVGRHHLVVLVTVEVDLLLRWFVVVAREVGLLGVEAVELVLGRLVDVGLRRGE